MENNGKIIKFHNSLMEFTREMKHILKKRLKILGFTRSQIRLIKTINQKQKIKISELGKIAHIRKSNITKSIDKLEDKEILERIPDKSDRRVTYLILTQQGKKVAEEISNIEDEFFKEIYKNIPEVKINQYIELFDEFKQYIKLEEIENGKR